MAAVFLFLVSVMHETDCQRGRSPRHRQAVRRRWHSRTPVLHLVPMAIMTTNLHYAVVCLCLLTTLPDYNPSGYHNYVIFIRCLLTFII